MKTQYVYVVTAYRWGLRDNHSYPVGVTARKKQAQDWAEYEEEHRGGKYQCEITEMPMGTSLRETGKGHNSFKVIKELPDVRPGN